MSRSRIEILICLAALSLAPAAFADEPEFELVEFPDCACWSFKIDSEVGDVDNDGLIDVVFVEDCGTAHAIGRISVLFGQPDGSYGDLVSTSSSGIYPSSLSLADLDADGILDAVVSHGVTPAGTFVFLGDGAGGWIEHQQATPANTFQNELGDFNKDGHLDLAVTRWDDIEIFLGASDGTFLPTGVVVPGFSFALGDLNGDDHLDIIATLDDVLYVHFGDGAGSFPMSLLQTLDGCTFDLAVADFDGDTDLDVATVNQPSGSNILLGDGAGGFEINISSSLSGVQITPADVDRDGFADLFVRPGTGDPVRRFHRSLGDGSFEVGVDYPAPPSFTLDHGDLNEDGWPDIFGVGFALIQQPPFPFRRGDVNANGVLDLSDPIRLAGFLFDGGAPLPCHDSADVDDSGVLDLADVVFLLSYLYLEDGALPPPPGPDSCGGDGMLDPLPECSYDACP